MSEKGTPIILLVALLMACAPRARPDRPEDPKFEGAVGTEKVARLTGTFARQIAQDQDLIGGPMASGRIGDYTIGNYLVRFVISDIEHAGGFSFTGGHLIDADRAEGGRDALSEVWVYLDNTFPRQASYESIEIVSSGAGAPAEILTEGADSQNPALRISTRYRLLPDADYLILQTTVTNTGSEVVEQYELGDAVQWGMSEHYGPGVGRALRGANNLGLPWLAGPADGVSYGYSAGGDRLNGPHGGGWSDPVVRTETLRPGQKTTYTRYFVVGTGDVGSVLHSIFALAGKPVGLLVGEVIDDKSGEGIVHATVHVDHTDGTPFAFAETDAHGRYRLPLEQGIYKVTFTAPGRLGGEQQEVGIGGGRLVRVQGRLGPTSRLAVRAREGRAAVPCKITVEGVDKTATPRFGPSFTAAGAGNTVYSLNGEATIPLAAGKYRVSVSRGIEYSLYTKDVTIKPGATVDVAASLRREVDTRGYFSADLHQHSRFSPDSAARLDDIVIANLAEGVELIAGTDHDFVPDYGAAVARLGVATDFKALSGNEITTQKWGHYGAFPLKPDRSKPRNGAIKHEGRDPKQILEELHALPEDPVVQLNHPRAGPIGLFDIVGYDFETGKAEKEGLSLLFDSIELFNGKKVANAERGLSDWYRLLSDGHKFTATGDSDSHALFGQERGYPRTFFASSARRPGDITDAGFKNALKQTRQVVVTNGPFVEMWANNQPVGSTIKAKAGKPVSVRIRVQAASWIKLDQLSLVQDGKVIEEIDLSGKAGVTRYDGRLSVKAAADSWILAIARGSAGLEPVVYPESGLSVVPLGFTNPIWIDIE